MVRVLPEDDTRFITFPSLFFCLSSFLELLLLIKTQFNAIVCFFNAAAAALLGARCDVDVEWANT
jgi:hypothetical protein